MSWGPEPLGSARAPILAEAVRMARDIRNAARKGGMQPDDPMAPLVEVLARGVMFVGQQCATVAGADGGRGRAPEHHPLGRSRGRRRGGGPLPGPMPGGRGRDRRQPLDGPSRRGSRAFGDRVRALDRRTAAFVGVAVIGALVLGAGGGWWAGDRSARAAIVATEDGVRAAFREGPTAAALWVDLMRWNDPRAALMVCREPGEVLTQGGRRGCRVPLWVGPPAALRP